MTNSANDADFFTAVHHLTLQQAAVAELRDDLRHDFASRQRVACTINGQLPPDDEFVEVWCCDLSSRGLSYLAPQSPAGGSLVFALGTPPYTYLQAEVVHSEQAETPEGPQWRIGCRFTGRVKR